MKKYIEKLTGTEILSEEFEQLLSSKQIKIAGIDSIEDPKIEKVYFERLSQAQIEERAIEQNNAIEKTKRFLEIEKLKGQLIELSHDVIQDLFGQVVPDIESRKQRAREIHNRIRALQGKEPRHAKNNMNNAAEFSKY